MRSLKDIKKSVAQAGIHTASDTDRTVLNHLLEQLPDNKTRTVAGHDQPQGRRSIMRSPLTKLAAAAAVLAALGIGFVGILQNGDQAAYAFEQTVEAMQGKRSFHIQTYFQQRRKDEFWAEFDGNGNLLRFRQHEGESPQRTLVSIWQDNVMSRYYPPPRGIHLMTSVENTGGGLEGLEEFDPETVVQEIHELVADGKAIMEIQEPSLYADLMTIHVTRIDGKPLTQVLVVDPDTKFVVRVDDYWGRDGEQIFHHGIEVLEYNETMDSRLFEPDFPEETILMDQVTQEVGMAQGDMTDEEVAVEILRQALDAWAQGDYAKAGKLCGGAPKEMLAEHCAHVRPVRTISIGQPERAEHMPRFRVPCQYEVERNGQTQIVDTEVGVFAVNGRPGRWYVYILPAVSNPSPNAIRDDGDTSEDGPVALAGVVIDQQDNALPDAWVFASYAAPGQTDAQGAFSLSAPPTDGSQTIGPIDLPMFVWAYTDDDPYSVAWTVIRPPLSDEADDSDEHVEQTHQGVALTIEDEDDFQENLPGSPGRLGDDGAMGGNPQIADVVLVTGPASAITGQVTDTNGIPLAEALVTVATLELQIGSNRLTVTELDDEWKAGFLASTDASGRYTVGHLPSSWTQATLVAQAQGYGQTQQLVLNAGQDTTCDIMMAEATSSEE
jgi:Carboxypeptidase regulatory-like domain